MPASGVAAAGAAERSAVLALLGDRAWRIPRRLDRILPHLDVEGDNVKLDQVPATALDGPHREGESVAR
ncbi:hypothetical protein ACWEWI_31510 [Streptomyces sp. NPDC003753]